MSTSFSSKFMIGATVAIVLSIIGGVIALGSSTQERARRLDARRVADLRGIADATDSAAASSCRGSRPAVPSAPSGSLRDLQTAVGRPRGARSWRSWRC